MHLWLGLGLGLGRRRWLGLGGGPAVVQRLIWRGLRLRLRRRHLQRGRQRRHLPSPNHMQASVPMGLLLPNRTVQHQHEDKRLWSTR